MARTEDFSAVIEDDAPRDIRLLVSGSSQDAVAKARISQVLEEALDTLRIAERTTDFFDGYTLNEAIQEELDRIGSEDDTADTFTGDRRTQIAELRFMLQQVESAVEQAKQLPVTGYSSGAKTEGGS